MPSLHRYLRPDWVSLDMKDKKKLVAIRHLANLLNGGGEVRDLRQFISALVRKETHQPPVTERRVAIAHCRHEAVTKPAICLGVFREAVCWTGTDEPVQILVLIAWPTRHESVYLQTVAELARHLRQEGTNDRLLGARTPEEALRVLCRDQ